MLKLLLLFTKRSYVNRKGNSSQSVNASLHFTESLCEGVTHQQAFDIWTSPPTVSYQDVTLQCSRCGHPGLRWRVVPVCSWCRGFRSMSAVLLQVLASQRSRRDPNLPTLLQPVPLCHIVLSTTTLPVVLCLFVLCTRRKETLLILEVWASGEDI